MIGPRLSLADLHGLRATHGGTIEPRPGGRYVLVGALFDGRRVTLGPVQR